MPTEIYCSSGFVAESVIIDDESKTMSAINIIEEINARQLPIVIYKINILYFLLKSKENTETIFDLKLDIYNNSKIILSANLKTNFINNFRTRSKIQLLGLVISDIGELIFDLSYKEQIIHSIKIPITYNTIQKKKEVFRPC